MCIFKSMPLLNDVQLNFMIINTLRWSHEFADFICEGYSHDSFYVDKGEWTKDRRIEAKDGRFLAP
jgi:outer membrane receptor for monomeric catechols